jgi:type IV pilus assembly protein PilY1
MLVFATGSYFRNSDITDTRLQSIYGLWDRLGSDVIPQSALVQQEYTNECAVLGGDAAEDDAETICARTLSSNPVPFTPPTADDEGVLGWFNELNVANAVTSSVVDFPGERAIRNIQIRGGLAFVNSVVPRQGGTCGSETGGFALSFCPVTGGMNCTSGDIFDVNNDGEFTELDRFVRGRVAALSFGSAAPSDAAFLGERRFTQLSDGTLSSVLTNTKVTRRSGRQSWRRIKNDR